MLYCYIFKILPPSLNDLLLSFKIIILIFLCEKSHLKTVIATTTKKILNIIYLS